MSELDFDELDKAVNNLMSGVPKVEPPKNDDIKTLDIDSTLPESSRPSLDELNNALTSVNGAPKTDEPASPATSTPAAAPLATRRAGRFMDVVHPSSDMKNAAKPMASRQGTTIEPATKKVDEMAASVLQPAKPDEPKEDNHVESEPTPVADDHAAAHAQNEWPDPLEMSGYQPEADTKADVEEKTETVPAVTEQADDDDDDAVFSLDDLEDTTPEPLTSPFITDAKVEKRPLGGPATDSAPVTEPVVTTAAAEEEENTTDDPNDQLPAKTADVAPILPPELQKDLMAIETDGDTSAHSSPVEEAPEANPAENAESKPESAKTETEPEKPVSEIPVPTGPTSIPQQYKEEESTSDQTNGGIYDTNNYHQPLAHPVKKKSGWLWIVWILLLLIIGGGGAAVLYLFNII